MAAKQLSKPASWNWTAQVQENGKPDDFFTAIAEFEIGKYSPIFFGISRETVLQFSITMRHSDEDVGSEIPPRLRRSWERPNIGSKWILLKVVHAMCNEKGFITVDGSTYTWWPSHPEDDQLPPGYRLDLECRVSPDGLRWFLPKFPGPGFVLTASLGGLSLLARLQNLDSEQRSTYHTMRFIWQQGHLLIEHLNRHFKKGSHLSVPLPVRGETGCRDVLPDLLGLDANGQGERWGPNELIKEGRAAANAKGDPRPNTAKCIRLGLLTAARRNPIDPTILSAGQAQSLVRMALFDAGPATSAINEEFVEMVYGRFVGLLEKHIDKPLVAFNKWMLEDLNNIVHSISKQKKHGGSLDRTHVRQAYLELVWRSFEYIGNCLHTQMRAFADLLPTPLTPAERAIFECLYLKQDYFGGLPLALLYDRFEDLKEAILEVWDCPNDQLAVGTLLRTLAYYREMVVDNRRGADRQYKRLRQHRNAEGKVSRKQELDPEELPNSVYQPGDFHFIVVKLPGFNELPFCRCGTRENWLPRLSSKSNDSEPLEIEVVCSICNHFDSFHCTRSEFEEVGRDIFENPA